MTDQQLEALAAQLDAHDDYRVVRRYQRPDGYHEPGPEDDDPLVGIYLDTETTGIDYQRDQIIELAMVRFEFAPDGRIFRLLDEFDELCDPGIPIPPEITALTGITDEMVRGRPIEPAAVEAFIADAAVVVAHNAAFDRKFVENVWSAFEKKAWACSSNEVPWRLAGYESPKLEYLAYRSGFFFDGHRAANDCLAGIHLLAQPLGDTGHTALRALLDNARESQVRLWAEGSPFESKDLLKARGYRWNSGENGRLRAWYIDLPEDAREQELEFLRAKVYARDVNLPTQQINAFNRFSARV